MITFRYLRTQHVQLKARALALVTIATIAMMSFATTSVAANKDTASDTRAQKATTLDSPKRLLNPPKEGELWWMRLGKGYTFCESVHRELQKYTPAQLGNCANALALSLPGVQELDGWTEIDPQEHADLFKRLMQYDAVGVDAYLGKQPEYFDQKKKSPEELQRWYEGFLKAGGRMRLLKVPLFEHPLGNPGVTYTEPQTVIEYRFKANKALCRDAPLAVDAVSTHFVSPDLSGPDPAILPYEASLALSGSRLMKYNGRVYLMTGTNNLTFYRRVKTGELTAFCEIQAGNPTARPFSHASDRYYPAH